MRDETREDEEVGAVMMTNVAILNRLFERSEIDLAHGPLFDTAPGPMPRTFDFGRVEGMMLGLAIGDALGATTEGQLPVARRAAHGEIRGYLPNRYAGGKAVGLPSDDSQLAFWTLEQMITDHGFFPERVAARFCQERIYGIGSAVSAFIANHKAGVPWHRCATHSAGNGALMRIAPIVIPHLASGTSRLWADAALSAMITHNDAASIAACLAFVCMLWALLQMDAPPDPGWWLETYTTTARELEVDRDYRPRAEAFHDYRGMIWAFAQTTVSAALRQGLSVRDACNRWYSGAYLMETVPSVLYILSQHGRDPQEAIVRAVNDTVDNDTIAAIVGAAVGALHGRDALPARWRSDLLGRTGDHDDGHIFELLEQARVLWWPGSRQTGGSMHREQEPTLAQIDALLRFLPLFDVPDRDFVERWAGGEKTESGATTVPYPIYPEDVLAFYQLAGQPCWSDDDYEPVKADQMLEDDALIRGATMSEVKTMLTYCVRGERFSDGHWAAMLRMGRIVALLKRLRILRDRSNFSGG
jgi:ADP-ribosylglycohydrolase